MEKKNLSLWFIYHTAVIKFFLPLFIRSSFLNLKKNLKPLYCWLLTEAFNLDGLRKTEHKKDHSAELLLAFKKICLVSFYFQALSLVTELELDSMELKLENLLWTRLNNTFYKKEQMLLKMLTKNSPQEILKFHLIKSQLSTL
jgi:hypothetical protein